MGGAQSSFNRWRPTNKTRSFKDGNYLVTERLFHCFGYVGNVYGGFVYTGYDEEWRRERSEPHPDFLAEQIANEAQDLLNNGQFSEAAAKFQEAYNLSNVSTVYQKFANSRDATNIAVAAQNLLSSGKFSEAAAKFQEAYNLSNVSTVYQKFANSRDATNIAAEGQQLLSEENYEAAIAKYQDAYNLCLASRNKDIYKNNEAGALNEWGRKLWKTEQYTEAASKFDLAYRTCISGYCHETYFMENRDEAKALALSAQGRIYYSHGNYGAAVRIYQEACNLCPSSRDKEYYENNLKKANEARMVAEANAARAAEVARKAEEARKIAEAKKAAEEEAAKEEEARKVVEAKRAEEIKNEKAKKAAEKVAKESAELIREGDGLLTDESLTQEGYQKALEKYNAALKINPHNSDVSTKGSIASNMIKGISLEEKGNELLSQAMESNQDKDYQNASTKYTGALEKFNSAHVGFTQIAKLDQRFNANRDNVKNEHIKAIEGALNGIKEALTMTYSINLNIHTIAQDNQEQQQDYHIPSTGETEAIIDYI